MKDFWNIMLTFGNLQYISWRKGRRLWPPIRGGLESMTPRSEDPPFISSPSWWNCRMENYRVQEIFANVVWFAKISCTQILPYYSRQPALPQNLRNFHACELPLPQIREIFLFYSNYWTPPYCFSSKMSVWKRLQRVGKRASKFQFTASYQELVVEVTKKW